MANWILRSTQITRTLANSNCFTFPLIQSSSYRGSTVLCIIKTVPHLLCHEIHFLQIEQNNIDVDTAPSSELT